MCRPTKSRFTPSRRQRECGAVPGDAPQSAKKQKDRIQRADVFDVPANPGKLEAVRDLWPDWQRGLRAEAMVARKDLMAGRQIRERLYAADEAMEPGIVASKAAIGAQKQQMVRAQAIGTITSWIGNRKNDVSDAIQAQFNPRKWGGRAKRRFAALDEDARKAIEADLAELRHELSAINIQKLWMVPDDILVMRKLGNGQLVSVSDRARRIAKAMFRGVAAKHKWPRFRNMSMRMDYRAGPSNAWLEPSDVNAFSWWLNLKIEGGSVALPIRGWGRGHGGRSQGALRQGALGKTVNLVGNDDGSIRIVLNRDMTDAFAASREAYQPKIDVLSFDFGLNTLVATSKGDLLGRGFKEKLLPLAEKTMEIMAREQKAGRKPGDCAGYNALIEKMRGMIDTEVNRVFNHAVALHRPRVIAVEKLDFRGMGLSRKLNRILSNCGRGAVEKKLNDLAERYGIEIHEVEPAYTSQTCSCCGYVDKAQRKGEKFQCRHCGMRMHADVNGARNIAQAIGQASQIVTETSEGCSQRTVKASDVPRRQKRKASSLSRTRSASLRVLVRRFDERVTDLAAVSRPRRGPSGARESASDPRLTNPYWKRHSLLLKGKSEEGRNSKAAACAVAT
ncbi:MAG: RNA-guided endonuclease InsQ/TnpB family protein [Limimaricola soesokkakensis]|uniref:RNA-guided endonuclease InsQ/TnpB family protein n=1 Tax=Limimaricola soesokkakensis TaxID=1343159 RepID=UPI00405A2A97